VVAPFSKLGIFFSFWQHGHKIPLFSATESKEIVLGSDTTLMQTPNPQAEIRS
jgi:hypothetical protein